MRKLKKLGVCLSMAVVGAIMMAIPASAKEMYNDIRDSYTEPLVNSAVNYTDDQKKALYENCRVNNPDDWFIDDYIKSYADKYNDDYYVGDVRSLNQFQLTRIHMDKYDNSFNYGVYVTNDPMNPSWGNYACKCSDSDFKALKDYWSNDPAFEEINNYSFIADIHYRDSVFKGKFTYDPETYMITIISDRI